MSTNTKKRQDGVDLTKVSSVQPKINRQYLILAVLEMYLFILRKKNQKLDYLSMTWFKRFFV